MCLVTQLGSIHWLQPNALFPFSRIVYYESAYYNVELWKWLEPAGDEHDIFMGMHAQQNNFSLFLIVAVATFIAMGNMPRNQVWRDNNNDHNDIDNIYIFTYRQKRCVSEPYRLWIALFTMYYRRALGIN